MQGIVVQTQKPQGLIPLYALDPSRGAERDVNLAPLTTYQQGRPLAQVSASANDVQTLTITGTPTGGQLVIAATHPVSQVTGTFVVLYNSTAAQAQANAQAFFGAGNIVVTGGPGPGTALVFTGAGTLVGFPIPVMTIGTNSLTGGSTPAGAIVHTTTGQTAGTFVPFVNGTTGPALCVLQYGGTTDASGFLNIDGFVLGGGYVPQLSSRAFFGGTFRASDIVGLDSYAIANLGKLSSSATGFQTLEIFFGG